MGRSRVLVIDGGDRSVVEGLVMGVEKVRWFELGFGARSRIPTVRWIKISIGWKSEMEG